MFVTIAVLLGARIEHHVMPPVQHLYKVWIETQSDIGGYYATGYSTRYQAARGWARHRKLTETIMEGIRAAGCTLPID